MVSKIFWTHKRRLSKNVGRVRNVVSSWREPKRMMVQPLLFIFWNIRVLFNWQKICSSSWPLLRQTNYLFMVYPMEPMSWVHSPQYSHHMWISLLLIPTCTYLLWKEIKFYMKLLFFFSHMLITCISHRDPESQLLPFATGKAVGFNIRMDYMIYTCR